MGLFILLSFSYCIRHLRDAHNRTWNQILLRSKRVSSSNTSDLCAIVWEAIIIKNQAQVVQIFIGHVDKFWLLSEFIRVKEFFKSAIVSYRFLHWLYFTLLDLYLLNSKHYLYHLVFIIKKSLYRELFFRGIPKKTINTFCVYFNCPNRHQRLPTSWCWRTWFTHRCCVNVNASFREKKKKNNKKREKYVETQIDH